MLICSIVIVSGLSAAAQDDFLAGREAARDAEADRLRLGQDFPSGKVPYLYDGELEDVGPQFLLRPGDRRHQWWRFLVDTQWFFNSNPTLADSSDRVETDVLINTVEFRGRSPAYETLGGRLELTGGAWIQNYFYGTASGPRRQAGGRDINDFNFTALTAFVSTDYSHGPWIGSLSLRWTRLSNVSGDDGFYREWAPSWQLGDRFAFGRDDLLTIRYQGSYHLTTSETFFFIRDDLNDCWSNGVSAVWTRRIAPQWFLQPYASASYEYYTNDPADRREWIYGGGAALIYQFGPDFSARVFTNYQKRDSNRAEFADYQQWTAGLGGSLSFTF